jgi:transcriptional regulator with GAF, ATPase, and Fis domain
MAKHGSNEVAFEIDVTDAGALSSGLGTNYITKISDYVVNREAVESTPFGVTDEQYLIGIIRKREPLTIEGWYDDTATQGPDEILNIGRKTHAATRTFLLTFATGKTVGGECWIEKYTRTMNIGDYHGFSAQLRMTGTITEAFA